MLLLDEPCSALDVKSSAVIEEMLTELKKQYTIVIVTHNIAQARRISDYRGLPFRRPSGGVGRIGPIVPGARRKRRQRAFLAGIYG